MFIYLDYKFCEYIYRQQEKKMSWILYFNQLDDCYCLCAVSLFGTHILFHVNVVYCLTNFFVFCFIQFWFDGLVGAFYRMYVCMYLYRPTDDFLRNINGSISDLVIRHILFHSDSICNDWIKSLYVRKTSLASHRKPWASSYSHFIE